MLGNFWRGLSEADKKVIKGAVVNGSAYGTRGSLSPFNTGRMKESLGSTSGLVAFIQDDSGEQLMKELSGYDGRKKRYYKDDILILDSQGHIVEYWESSKSGLFDKNNDIFKALRKMAAGEYKNKCYHAEDPCDTNDCHPMATCTSSDHSYTCSCGEGYYGDGKSCRAYTCETGTGSSCKTCMSPRMMKGDNQCSACNDGYKLDNAKKCVKIEDVPETPETPKAECDVQDNMRPKGGKKVNVGKVKSACECHDKCLEKENFKAYMFTKPRMQKNGKMTKKGKCQCYPGSGKKRRIKFKSGKKYISGNVA